MATDKYTNYEEDDRNDAAEIQNTNNQYREPENEYAYQEQQLSDNEYLDNEFSNALDRDDEEDLDNDEDDWDEEDDLDEDDLDDDLVEDYDENDREPEEPETFADDGYKID